MKLYKAMNACYFDNSFVVLTLTIIGPQYYEVLWHIHICVYMYKFTVYILIVLHTLISVVMAVLIFVINKS